jgi:hypothetical protein
MSIKSAPIAWLPRRLIVSLALLLFGACLVFALSHAIGGA